MLRPFLIIGLGGSGGKTLQTLRDELLTLLRQRGWSGPLPRAWQLLQIDVPPVPQEHDRDLPAPMSGDSYVGLARQHVNYPTINTHLQERINGNVLANRALTNWRPASDQVNVAVSKGAGQYRAIGRVLALTYIGQIEGAIRDAISRMQGMSAEEELRRAARTLGIVPEGAIPEPAAVVVSSIAGGTGAGMVMDVSDVLRLVGNSWANESYGFFYTPEVFEDLPPASRQGVRPNAFATLSEILAGYWDKDGFSKEEEALLQLLGMPTSKVVRLGVRYPFLVGRSNGTVTFGSQNDVYRSMGRALSAWVMSEEIQSKISNYVTGNWAQSAGSRDLVPFKEPDQEAPFSALGFARVNLGLVRFRKYAAERLARLTAERLLEGHLQNKQDDDPRSNDRVLEETAAREKGDFISAAGFELTYRDAIGSGGGVPLMRGVWDGKESVELYKSLVAGANSRLQDENGDLDSETVSTEVGDRRAEQESRYRAAAGNALRKWVVQSQERLVRVTMQYSGKVGVPATLRLLELLEGDLDARRDKLKEQARKLRSGSGLPFGGGGAGPTLDAQIDHYAREMWRGFDADFLDRVCSLLPEVKKMLIAAVRRELDGALQQLRKDTENPDEGFKTWPSKDQVPRRLRPTENERMLITADEFPSLLWEKLGQQFSGETDGDQFKTKEAVDKATKDVVVFPVAGPNRSADKIIERPWIPSKVDIRPKRYRESNPSQISVSFDLRPKTILANADSWLAREDTFMGQFLQTTMQGYFDEDTVSTQQLLGRLDQLRSQLSEAIKASAPLVAIDEEAVATVHPDLDPKPTRFFSGFPFPPGSKAAEVVHEVLQVAGMGEEARLRNFVEHNEKHVDVFAVLPAPMEPVVFDSLMGPLATAWGQAAQGGREELERFWTARRSRPLTQFIPMAPPIRRAMVRGWFTAHLIGCIETTKDRIQICQPATYDEPKRWLQFPAPLLEARDVPTDNLAGVLTTAMAALVQVNSNGGHNKTEPLDAYRRLLELGLDKSRDPDRYSTLNPELEEWLTQDKSRTPAEQREEALAKVKVWRDGYIEKFELESHDPAVGRSLAWELREDYIDALCSLVKRLESMETTRQSQLV